MPRRKPGGRSSAVIAALLVGAFGAPDEAAAGRKAFLFAYDSEIVPEGDVELEQWLWAESRIPPNDQRPIARSALYWIWWAPVIGLTNHLELALPFQIVASANNTSVQFFSADALYRFFSREKDGGFQPLVRASYRQAIQARSAPSTLELDFVLTYGKPNELHLTTNVGASISAPWPENLPRPVTGTFSAGLSFPLTSELRLSAEVLGEFQDRSSSAFPRYFAGGALSYTRGRLWLTAGTMVGITGLSSATPPFIPRLLWAVAL
jgi:hypothetical protein